MEVTAAVSTTGSQSIADLIPLAAAKYAGETAVRYKRDEAWHDVTYAELADLVQELGLGLIDVGVQPGERVCILANTRPEWSYVDMAATSVGAVVVPIYPTNSPEECLWVISDSEASTIVCENEEQLAKIAAIHEQLPHLRTIIVIDPVAADADSNGSSGGRPALETITLEQVRERGHSHSPEELEARRAAVKPEDDFTFIYTSGTTGPPKGCVLTHGNYRAIVDMICEAGEIQHDEVTYLYLPLAHSYALLVQLAAFDLGSTLVYFGGDTKQIVPELIETKPTYLPSVPRIFEKAYTLAHSVIEAQSPEEQERTQGMIALGMKVRDLMAHDEPVPEELQRPFEQAEEALFTNVRAIFGGRIRHGTSGAAPIAREILEFFWACGVPVLEGYGMTETATAATISTAENHRFGTVGRPLPGEEIKIADDGEILIKGPNIFKGYHNQASTSFGAVLDGWLHTGDLGGLDDRKRLLVTGRKVDTIVSGGENVAPAEVEAVLETHPQVLEAAVVGRADPQWGEAVTAIVVPRPGAVLDPEQLRAHCAAQLAPFKVPKRVTFSSEPLPRTSWGKLVRRELR